MNYRKQLEVLRGLFQTPFSIWSSLEKENIPSAVYILRHHYLIFIILIPVLVTIRQMFSFKSFTILFYQGILLPVIAILTYLLVLYILSILMEEAADFMGGRAESNGGIKLAFYSGLPFLSMVVFSVLPFGFILVFTGFIYQITLIYAGCVPVLKVPSSRKWFWMLTIVISFILLLFLFFLVAFLGSFLMNFL